MSIKTNRKYALSIGVGKVNKCNYGNDRKTYDLAPKCAKMYRDFFNSRGFEPTNNILLNDVPKCEDVLSQLLEWSWELDKGDLMIISFTGHGARYWDNDESLESKSDKKRIKGKGKRITDEDGWVERGWCMHDRILFHFEIWEVLKRFRSGVKIVAIVDSCYAGNVDGEQGKFDFQSLTVSRRDIYSSILDIKSRPRQFQAGAALVVLSSSTEDGPANTTKGLTVFAKAFLKAWKKGGKNIQSYSMLFEGIQRNIFKATEGEIVEKKQSPRWHYYQGHSHTNLDNQKPIF